MSHQVYDVPLRVAVVGPPITTPKLPEVCCPNEVPAGVCLTFTVLLASTRSPEEIANALKFVDKRPKQMTTMPPDLRAAFVIFFRRSFSFFAVDAGAPGGVWLSREKASVAVARKSLTMSGTMVDSGFFFIVVLISGFLLRLSHVHNEKGRDLITPLHRHWYALTGTLSGTPVLGMPRTVSRESKLPVSWRTAAEAANLFFVWLHNFYSNKSSSTPARETWQAIFCKINCRDYAPGLCKEFQFFISLVVPSARVSGHDASGRGSRQNQFVKNARCLAHLNL